MIYEIIHMYVCEAGGGVLCEMLGGVCHRGSETHSRVSIKRNYVINFTSNALFCILGVRLDFIRVVVLL